MKKCNRCKIEKGFEEFSKDSRAKSGTQTRCKKCQAEVKKEMATYYRAKHLEYKYGITLEDYDQLKEQQNGKCAICGIEEKYCENKRFAVDHDHDTEEVRALLCKKCNQAIGLLQDSSEFAFNAYTYLRKFNK
jgi:hypothetical protein